MQWKWSQSKSSVTTGLVALVEDMRPEVTLLIGLSKYPSQSHKGGIINIHRVVVCYHVIILLLPLQH